MRQDCKYVSYKISGICSEQLQQKESPVSQSVSLIKVISASFLLWQKQEAKAAIHAWKPQKKEKEKKQEMTMSLPTDKIDDRKIIVWKR